MSDLHFAPSVVVGVDGSREATYAARWAIDEAISRDVPLRLVYVIDSLVPSGVDVHDAAYAPARAALSDAYRDLAAAGKPVKVETEILWGRPLNKLMHASRSAAMICVGSIGLNHARRGGGSVAAALAESALCPVAVVRRPSGGPAIPEVGVVIAEVDNGRVLRHAFEEARLRGVPLRALCAQGAAASDDTGDGNRWAQAQLSRRLARWTTLYPDVPVEPAVVCASVDRYLATNAEPDQLLVTDAHTVKDRCGGHGVRCSVLTVRCGNL